MVRIVGSTLSFEPVHSVHGETAPAALIDLRSWTGLVGVGEGFVTYKAARALRLRTPNHGEALGVELKNCSAFIRKSINQERNSRDSGSDSRNRYQG